MDLSPPHLFPPPAYSLIFCSSCLHILFMQMLVVITFASDKCFGLVT
jgi:hypothetical protein